LLARAQPGKDRNSDSTKRARRQRITACSERANVPVDGLTRVAAPILARLSLQVTRRFMAVARAPSMRRRRLSPKRDSREAISADDFAYFAAWLAQANYEFAMRTFSQLSTARGAPTAVAQDLREARSSDAGASRTPKPSLGHKVSTIALRWR